MLFIVFPRTLIIFHCIGQEAYRKERGGEVLKVGDLTNFPKL